MNTEVNVNASDTANPIKLLRDIEAPAGSVLYANDATAEKLNKIKKFADKCGIRDRLDKQLEFLATYSSKNVVCQLYEDFAFMSLGFVFLSAGPPYSRWFNGGLIYDGPGYDNDGSFPQLTVSLVSQNDNRGTWNTNT